MQLRVRTGPQRRRHNRKMGITYFLRTATLMFCAPSFANRPRTRSLAVFFLPSVMREGEKRMPLREMEKLTLVNDVDAAAAPQDLN